MYMSCDLLCRVEEETQQAFGNDVILLFAGYVLTFTYFALFLGKFNRKEHKVCTMYFLRGCLMYRFVLSALGCSNRNSMHWFYYNGSCWTS